MDCYTEREEARRAGNRLCLCECVVQDYAEAIRLFRLAVEDGHAQAMYALGTAYLLGNGVVEDYVKAHMWINLSAALSAENAIKQRTSLAELMTQQQIAEAQKLARECLARKYKGC